LTELLNHYQQNEITFSGAGGNSVETLHILQIHNVRESMENARVEKFVFGYEELMPSLTNCQFDHLKVFDVTTEIGSYIIFTDVDLNTLIGILKSKRTLTEIREKYITHDKLFEENNQKPIYDWRSNETIFINGKLRN
jgi:hypothetical protein